MAFRTPYAFIRHQVAKVVRKGLWAISTPIPGPYTHAGGHRWHIAWTPRFPLPAHPAVLVEDGKRLPGTASDLRFVEAVGYGAYRMTPEGLYFATTDNSDPNHNGRQYRLVWNAWNAFVDHVPVNLRRGELSASQLNQRVEETLNLIPGIEQIEQTIGTTIAGKDLLEVGPGPDYAWTLMAACLGARCSVADPFGAVWSDDYHPRFYRALAQRMERHPRMVTTQPLERLLETRDFSRSEVSRYDVAAESLTAPDNTFDLVFSNAVGEHFYDISAAFREMARVTRPGGFGHHVIDLRDHRDFSRPLEYLLMNEGDFWREFINRHAECGNRLRECEFLAVVRDAGFEPIANRATLKIASDYLEEFIPRLRSAGNERYRHFTADELQPSGIALTLRKRPQHGDR